MNWDSSVRKGCCPFFHWFADSIIYLYYCGLRYLFILWVIIKYYHYLFYCSNCFRFVFGSAFRLAPMFFKYIFFFGTSLFSGTTDVPGPLCVFPFPDLESTMFLRSPGSLFEEWYLDTKTWVLCELIARGVSLFPDLLSRQGLEIINVS